MYMLICVCIGYIHHKCDFNLGDACLGVMSFCRFSIIYVCGPTSMKLIPHLVSKVRKV